ncbi:MAG: hypothetical protein LiPW15_656 [Parcubacteria group bacterium LiPW_15]|nr:MAG: hypothetical protein LiPW15_656 [Parcubacteria group bacterium LiPW_15]
MLKNILIVIFMALLVFAGMEIRSILGQRVSVSAQFEEARKELEQAKTERGRLEADLNYVSIPENLEKELRARFHYQSPDEKVMILVPRENTTTSTSTP